MTQTAGHGGSDYRVSHEGFEGSSRYTPCKGKENKKIMDRQTLSIMKACEVVGVSRRTIYNWISAGKVEYVRTAGGSSRIRSGVTPRRRARSLRTAIARPQRERTREHTRVPSGRPARQRTIAGGAPCTVPSAEQSAGDHPGARGTARDQVAGRRLSCARVADRRDGARGDGHESRARAAFGSVRTLTAVTRGQARSPGAHCGRSLFRPPSLPDFVMRIVRVLAVPTAASPDL